MPTVNNALSQQALRTNGSSFRLKEQLTPSVLQHVKDILAANQAKPAAEQADLGKLESALDRGKDFNVQIYLLGFRPNDDFDPEPANDTGEFYFTSMATNGTDVNAVGSRGANGAGAEGVWTGVVGTEWVPTGNIMLWPDEAGPTVTTPHVWLDFHLLERDSDEFTKKLLDNLEKAADGAIAVYASGNKFAEKGAEAFFGLARDLSGLAAEHDPVISQTIGFSGPLENYKVGQFVRLSAANGSEAILSVVPDRDPSTTDWDYRVETGIMGRRTIEVPLETAAEERLVSIFVRPGWWSGKLPPTSITVNGSTYSNRRPFIRHLTLGPGHDPIRVQVEATFPTDVHVLATVVQDHGARPTAGLIL